MEWFEDFEEIETPAAKPARDRELVPEGEHRFTIKRSGTEDGKFSVALAADDDRYGWVWGRFPTDIGWGQKLIVSLAKALGYAAAPWKEADPEALIGRTVRARVYHRVGNTGRTFVNVGEFLPDPEQILKQAGPAHTKARTADQKFKAEQRGGGDDIPF